MTGQAPGGKNREDWFIGLFSHPQLYTGVENKLLAYDAQKPLRMGRIITSVLDTIRHLFDSNRINIVYSCGAEINLLYFIYVSRLYVTCGLKMWCPRTSISLSSSITTGQNSLLRNMQPYKLIVLYLLIFPVLLGPIQWKINSSFIVAVHGCRPGSYSSNRLAPRKLTPFVYRQHVPNVSEKTIGASGPAEGKIARGTKRFREELITNLNPNIVFKDEEQSNADRMMTERCRDRLNRLAMMVSEHWKNEVKLRVIEAWDEDCVHEDDSLHYEGRAVDITTTDRDRDKYGMLARLAVEAGFDWVFYESRSYVHCSVKADKSDAARYGGCFSGDSYVTQLNGKRIPLSEAKPGDAVLTMDESGNVVEDRILTFMHISRLSMYKKPTYPFTFKQLTVESGETITLTSNHLIKSLAARTLYGRSVNASEFNARATFIYARQVQIGDYVMVMNSQVNKLSVRYGFHERQTGVERVVYTKNVALRTGVFAPLTQRGTVAVNGVLASCYAVFENHDISHFVLSPLRYYHIVKRWVGSDQAEKNLENLSFVSWYPKVLFDIVSLILPKSLLYT